MIHIGLVLSALIFLFSSHGGVIPIKSAIALVPRSNTIEKSNSFVEVSGVITVPSSRTDSSLQAFVQDKTGGIRLYDYTYRGPALFVGDSVLAEGKLGIYYGQEEIESPRITVLKRGVVVQPEEATAAEIVHGVYHGMLVHCNGRIIREVSRGEGLLLYFVDKNNDTAIAYEDFGEDPQFYLKKAKVGESYSITGISTRFSFTKPYTSNDDILLRSSADIQPSGEGFFYRHSVLMEWISTAILAIVALLAFFTFILQSRVKQKTRQLEEQARILRMFFDSVAELTGLLEKDEILTLALRRGYTLAGVRSAVFGRAVSSVRGLILIAFEISDGRLNLETQRFSSDLASHLTGALSGRDAIWETTIDDFVRDISADGGDDTLSAFLRSHLYEKNLTVIAPNHPSSDLLVIFDHAGPISPALPHALITSYVLHVYSAYRAAELFDVVRKQGAALERLYNNSVFGLMTLSEHGVIMTANRIAMQMFEDEGLVGKRIQSHMTSKDSGRLDDLLSSLVSVFKEKFVRFAAEIETAQGHRNFEFAIQFDPVLKTIYTTVQDTGDRQYYEDYAAKEEKIETLEKLATSLTHDLNNIVGSITGYASLLKRKLPRDSKDYHYADIIESSSRRTTELVKEVLGFAQLDAKTLEVVDLNKFTSDILNEFRKTRGDKYSILLKPSSHPIQVRVSTSQIRQVLFAILTNAVDAMEGGGTIACSVGTGGLPNQTSVRGKPDEFCFVEVEDHGIGMDDTIKRRIFEPFFTTKRTKRYTGLSLSMAHNILKHHKGFISVESTPGTGTRVRIHLPRFGQKLEQQVELPIARSTEARGAKILVVDDEEGVRQLACDILTDHGYTVVTASDGRQALERLNENPDVKLVVLDMVMPVMGGRDACIEIKKRADAPKVLICTGYSELSDLESILGKHADGLIQKPYATRDMVKAVEHLLGLAS